MQVFGLMPPPYRYSFPASGHIFLMPFIISFFAFAFLSKSELMCSDVKAAASPEELLSKPPKSQARTYLGYTIAMRLVNY